MDTESKNRDFKTAREKFLALSLESTRKSYYPQLQEQLEAARKNEQQLRLITDNLPAMIYYVDANQLFQFVNSAFEEALGISRERIIGEHIRTVISEPIYSRMEQYFRRALSGEPLSLEEAFSERTGKSSWWGVNLVPSRNAEGAVIGFFGVAHDLTERKRSEEALRQSEDKYRRLVENANEAIFILQDGRIRFPNPKTMAIFGCAAREFENLPFLDVVHPEDRRAVTAYIDGIMGGAKEPQALLTFRLVNCRDEHYTMQINAVKVSWEGRPAVLNFLTDITVLKKLEDHLQRAQKMEAIGKLAGGIAHDFNNLLMGIQGRVSVMMIDMDLPRKFADQLESIEAHVKSAADLAQRLLGFARGGKYETRPADLNEIVEQSADMFGRTKKEIRIHENFAPDLWPVEVDRRQIEQVLINLFVNAGQAMPGGGDLYLRTENVTLDAQDIPPAFHVQPGRFVMVSVADTGIGMDEATLARAFDPFFTTKEIGRGTGLGLASAYGIIENHHGLITIQSEKDKGTTVTVFLPASEKALQEKIQPRAEPAAGAGTILLIDDEPMILDVGKDMIETLGYNVHCVRGGKDAVSFLETHPNAIDMVILDMIMPDMSGAEAFEKIKEISPKVKVMLSSGYSIEGQATEIMNRGCEGFIQKPFDLNTLADKISSIL